MRLGRIQNNYTKEGFDAVKETGLSFIEICCNSEEDMIALCQAEESVKEEIARTGIDVSSVGRWNHTILEDGRIHEGRLQGYYALLDTAIALGARTFVVGCNLDPTVSLYQNYTLAIRFLGGLIARADGRIRIAIQNCDWNNFLVSPAEWRIVLGELPELCIKYDPSHAYNRGADYLAELSEWGDRIAHLHVKGTTHAGKRAVDDPPAGMDDLRWPSIFAVLYARGYEGDLSIEPHSKTWLGDLGERGIAFTQRYIQPYLL